MLCGRRLDRARLRRRSKDASNAWTQLRSLAQTAIRIALRLCVFFAALRDEYSFTPRRKEDAKAQRRVELWIRTTMNRQQNATKPTSSLTRLTKLSSHTITSVRSSST